MRVEGGNGCADSGDSAVSSEVGGREPPVDRITQMAYQILQGAEGAPTRRRAICTDRRLTGTFQASPGSQRQMVREATDPSTSEQPFSAAVEQRIRLHQRLRSDATQAIFREMGAFRATGLRVVVLPALIQVGRGSIQTPAAHTCPAPAVILTLPASELRSADERSAEGMHEAPAEAWRSALRLPQVMALVRASQGQQQLEEWNLPAEEMTQQRWESLEGWLRRGILMQGATARLGAMTIEVPKVANEFDSEMERTERAVIEEALNSVTMEGSAWRDTASEISMRLHQAADAALQRALQALELGDRIRDLVQQNWEDVKGWDEVIQQVRQQPRSALWQSLLDAILAHRESLQRSPPRRNAASAAAGLILYHQRKAEVAAQALQAFRSPGTVRQILSVQTTPSPRSVAGALGDAYASVRCRHRSRSFTAAQNSSATVLSFEDDATVDEDAPAVKRACVRPEGYFSLQPEPL